MDEAGQVSTLSPTSSLVRLFSPQARINYQDAIGRQRVWEATERTVGAIVTRELYLDSTDTSRKFRLDPRTPPLTALV